MVQTEQVQKYASNFFENKTKDLMFTEDLINLLLNIILVKERKDEMIERASKYLKASGFLDKDEEPTDQAYGLKCSKGFEEVK